MGYKEDALDFLGITKWHKAGYTGKGIKILSDEKVCEAKHSDVISPAGFNKKEGHGDGVMLHIKLVAPDAEFIAYPLSGSFTDKTYKSKCEMSEFTDFRVAYYGAMLEASMRLKGGHIVPLWEDLNFSRLKKEMKKIKGKV